MMKKLPTINSDQPLRTSDAIDHDKLQRRGFAESAVAALQRVTSTAGFVLSIEGPWGSGKTSTLAMMEQVIRMEDKDESIIVHFNPWLVGERDSLLRQFLNSVATAIRLKDPAGDAKKVSEELLNYADIFDFVKWVPGAEPWASIVKGVIKSAGKATGGVADQKARDIEGQKDKLEKALGKLDKRIYVFIDDVDRLFPTEVFEMVRIIKAIGQLPNVGYIVAWDPDYIRRALRAATVPLSENYIDKIVQVRLPVPAISAHARLQLLNDGIASLQGEATANHFPKQDERLQSLYSNGLRELLEQPRDVTRVINTMSVIEPGLRGEVVLADILGLACLMVRAPRVYETLRRDPELFTSGNSTHADRNTEVQEERRKKMDRLYAKTPNPDAVRELIHHLFPAAAQATGRFAYGNAVDVEGHLAAPSRLNIAMTMAIGATDVSLVDAKHYILQPYKRQEIESKLTSENCVGFLDMLGDVARTVSDGDIPDLEELCLLIARLIDKQPISSSDNRRRFFALRPEALSITAIKRLVDSNKTSSVDKIAYAIVIDPQALTVAAEILGEMSATNQVNGSLVVKNSKTNTATNKFVTNTVDAIVNDTFWDRCNSSRILWTIMRVAPNSAKRVFSTIKRHDPSLDRFALSFLKHGYSSNGGQSYALTEDPAVSNMIDVEAFTIHAKRRLKDSSVGYPARAAWMSVVQKKPVFGSDGSDAGY